MKSSQRSRSSGSTEPCSATWRPVLPRQGPGALQVPSATFFLWDRPTTRNRRRKGVLVSFLMLLNACFLHMATLNLHSDEHVYWKLTHSEHHPHPFCDKQGPFHLEAVSRDWMPQTRTVSAAGGALWLTQHTAPPQGVSGESPCTARLQKLWEALQWRTVHFFTAHRY